MSLTGTDGEASHLSPKDLNLKYLRYMKIERKTIEQIGIEATLTRERGKNRSLFLKADGINSCVEICLDKEDVEALRKLLSREDNQD